VDESAFSVFESSHVFDSAPKIKKESKLDQEIQAMSKIAEALEVLDDDAKTRVLRWASDRYGIALTVHKKKGTDLKDSTDPLTDAEPDPAEYESLAELFAEASPNTEAEKVLVAGYWHQKQGADKVESAPINKDLKDLGHGIGSMNHAFDALMKEKPQLAIQLKKGGTSRQARKEYKITKAGMQKVEQMLKNQK
jgi:hypothetical protein